MTWREAFKDSARFSGGQLRSAALWGILPAAFYWFAQGPGYGLAVGVTITLMVYAVRLIKNAGSLRSVSRSHARRAMYQLPD